MTIEVSEARIDAGADALRKYEMTNKMSMMLTPWLEIPNSTKKKWRIKARIVLEAAARVD